MKKITLLVLSLILLLSLSLLCMTACDGAAVSVEFSQKEYEIHSGDKVFAAGKKVTYALATKVEGVSVDEQSGEFTVAPTVPDCTQVVVLAKVEDVVFAGAVCRLRTATATPTLAFDCPSDYVVSGDSVKAVSTPAYSVLYSLKQEYDGISVNSVSGKVSYSSNVADGLEFTVVAKAKDASCEHTFKTVVGNYVTAVNDLQIAEYQKGATVSYVLDFRQNPEAERVGVLQVIRGRNALESDLWSYDKETKTLTVDKSVIAEMSMGENLLKIVTFKNSVTVTVRVATFLATAKEVAAINNSREALSGYYIMVCDIDLSEYLSKSGEGYNSGKGWTPIGTYHDVLDGTATDWAFAGTFDGNGHTITGFFIDRIDEYAYNSGFFGYIASQGCVKNLGVKNAIGKVNNVRSYSGGFAGVNVGKISDCWADVTVETGEVFKVVGGFVGRNEGEIINCYSLGKVSGGSQVGCFAGVSLTDISLGTATNCYAVQTGSYPFSDFYDKATNGVFASKTEMKNADFSAYSSAWNVIEGDLPKLKSVALEYDLREIKITNTKTNYTRGDVVEIAVQTNPASKLNQLPLTFEVLEGDADCLEVEGNVARVATRQFTPGENHFKVAVSCGDLKAFYEFDVWERVSTISFDDTMETVLYAGMSYYLDVTVTPDDSDSTVEFSFDKSLQGVTVSNGIVSVSPYVADGQVKIVATSVNGKTATLAARVVANKAFPQNYAIIYRGETENVSFTLPAGVGAQVEKVTRHDKTIPYTVDGDKVTMDTKYFVDFGIRDITVKFLTEDSVYVATVVAYDRKDVVEIGTVEEFLQFKANKDMYGKVIVLTADLDFEDITITALGSHHIGWDFTGVFNGNGHTIKNLNIDRNDFSGSYTDEDGVEKGDENTYKYHASRFNVGLFSYLTGTVTNVHFQNVNVASRFQGEANGNFVGVVAGTITGTVSHCTFTSCSAKAGGDIVGTIGGKIDSAVIEDCFINGNLYLK